MFALSKRKNYSIGSPPTQKLEKHPRLLAITDLYNSPERNKVMNLFPCIED